MRKLYFLSLLLATCCWTTPVRAAEEKTHIMIAAIQTGEVNATGNDFVVLHNPTSKAVDITGWRLQYRAAGAKGTNVWATKRVFGCLAATSDCRLRVATKENIIASTYELPDSAADQPLVSGFSDEGGQIRIVRPNTHSTAYDVVDMVGYGTTVEAEGKAALAPALGKAIVRKSTNVAGMLDTQQNKNDFTEGCYKPSSKDMPAIITCPEDTTPTDPDEEDPTYAALIITELLPDPVSPATDSKDEFIEIFNPTSQAVSLKGYTIQIGSNGKHTFTFKGGSVAAQSYTTVRSADSRISLTNEGSSVQLLDPSGKQVSTVPSYDHARPGAAWVQLEGVWQWTVSPTPGAANVLNKETPAPVVQSAPHIKKATTKKAAPKTTAVKATKGVNTAKKPSAKTSAAAKSVAAAPSQTEVQSNFNYVLLICVGLGVLAYAGYEYRHDISRVAGKVWHGMRGRK